MLITVTAVTILHIALFILHNLLFRSTHAIHIAQCAVHKHAPDTSVCGRRKNIGYLWAIKHGASVIYETDDDNVLLDTHITVLDAGEYAAYVAGETRRTVNVYESFGLPNMWPRGLPLADIKEPAPTRFQRRLVKPLIQQGKAPSSSLAL